jgi:hypothetical protein
MRDPESSGLHDASFRQSQNQDLNPTSNTGSVPSLYHLTSGRRSQRLHHNPASGGQGFRKTGPFSTSGFESQRHIRSVLPGSAEQLLLREISRHGSQARLKTAPSITTPRVAYFHKATSNFRARATIATFLPRPSLARTRSWNQRASDVSG